MDLTYEELEALIDKIAVGKSFLLIDDSFITLIYPDNAIKIKAKQKKNENKPRKSKNNKNDKQLKKKINYKNEKQKKYENSKLQRKAK